MCFARAWTLALQDFWERFLACLKALKGKGQRTVYRLTLVKSWNMEEVEDYIKLLEVSVVIGVWLDIGAVGCFIGPKVER